MFSPELEIHFSFPTTHCNFPKTKLKSLRGDMCPSVLRIFIGLTYSTKDDQRLSSPNLWDHTFRHNSWECVDEMCLRVMNEPKTAQIMACFLKSYHSAYVQP